MPSKIFIFLSRSRSGCENGTVFSVFARIIGVDKERKIVFGMIYLFPKSLKFFQFSLAVFVSFLMCHIPSFFVTFLTNGSNHYDGVIDMDFSNFHGAFLLISDIP